MKISRTATGRASAPALVAVMLVAVLSVAAALVIGRDADEPTPVSTGPAAGSTPAADGDSGCLPGPEVAAPTIDLGVQASTRDSLLPRESIDTLVGLAQQAGASVISTSTSWRYLQPTRETAPADFRFEGIDRVIESARAAGLQVRLQLIGMPAWAVDDPTRPWSRNRPPLTSQELADWTSFVTAVAEYVAGRVDYLEVWNEPNGTTYWPTGPDPTAFAALLAATYAPVRAVAPDLQVIAGGLVGNDIGYLEALYDAVDASGATSRPFDLVGVHPFTGSAAPSTVDPARVYEREPFGLFDDNFTGFDALHDVMAERGDEDLDLYIGAFGYADRPGEGAAVVPDQVRAGYVAEALELVTCRSDVRVLSWYYLHPTPFDPVAWTLVDEELRPNLTFAAFVTWAQQVAGSGAPTVGAGQR